MSRQGAPSPMRRSQTEANLNTRTRAASPPPQAPNNGRPRSPREANSRPPNRFPKGGGEAAGSNSEPASPVVSPRQHRGRGGTPRRPTRTRAILSSAVERRAPSAEDSLASSSSTGRDVAGSSRDPEQGRGTGRTKRSYNDADASRLEREHKELVRAFGEKCEQLRASHAALMGAELRLAQMEASGASEVMRQRLEAAEAAALSATTAQRDREAELTRRINQLEAENNSLRRGMGLSPQESLEKPAPMIPTLPMAATVQLGQVGDTASSSSSASPTSNDDGEQEEEVEVQVLDLAQQREALLHGGEEEVEVLDDGEDDDEEGEEEEEEGEEEEGEEEAESEGEEEDEEGEEEEEEEAEEVDVAKAGSVFGGAIAATASVPSPFSTSRPETSRSESLKSDSSLTSAEATGASPRPEIVIARGIHGGSPEREGGYSPREGGKGAHAKQLIVAVGAKVSSQVEKTLFSKLPSSVGAPPPNPHMMVRPNPVPPLIGATAGGSRGGSRPNSSGRSGAGLDFLEALARAESQPPTPTSQS